MESYWKSSIFHARQSTTASRSIIIQWRMLKQQSRYEEWRSYLFIIPWRPSCVWMVQVNIYVNTVVEFVKWEDEKGLTCKGCFYFLVYQLFFLFDLRLSLGNLVFVRRSTTYGFCHFYVLWAENLRKLLPETCCLLVSTLLLVITYIRSKKYARNIWWAAQKRR